MKLSWPPFRPSSTLLTRRGLLVEAGIAALVISIPAVAIIATAQPIPNPPGRETKTQMSSAHQELKEQRRAAARARIRQAKKRDHQKRAKRERRAK